MKKGKKIKLHLLLQSLLALLVVGLFVVSCGSDDPTGLLNSCGSDGAYCRNAGVCCPTNYPYYCSDKVDESQSKTGCYQSNCGSSCCDAQMEYCS